MKSYFVHLHSHGNNVIKDDISLCGVYVVYNDDNFSLVVFYIFISTSNLYVQQCSQITGAALYDVYKCNMKSTNMWLMLTNMMIWNVHVLI